MNIPQFTTNEQVLAAARAGSDCPEGSEAMVTTRADASACMCIIRMCAYKPSNATPLTFHGDFKKFKCVSVYVPRDRYSMSQARAHCTCARAALAAAMGPTTVLEYSIVPVLEYMY